MAWRMSLFRLSQLRMENLSGPRASATSATRIRIRLTRKPGPLRPLTEISVYALSSDGDIACLEAKGGKIRWQKNIRKEFGGQPGEWAYAESPLVDGDVVVVTPGGAEATIVALNKKTGAVIWKSAVPGGDPAGYASAIVVQGGGRKQYVQLLTKGIVGVDAKTGQFLWRYKDVAKGPAQYFTPVAHAEYVYGGALGVGGGLVRLKLDQGGVAAEQVYFTRGLPNGIGGAVQVGETLYGTEAGAEAGRGRLRYRQSEMAGQGYRLEFDSLRRWSFISSRR